jgi:hypothetical protein
LAALVFLDESVDESSESSYLIQKAAKLDDAHLFEQRLSASQDVAVHPALSGTIAAVLTPSGSDLNGSVTQWTSASLRMPV